MGLHNGGKGFTQKLRNLLLSGRMSYLNWLESANVGKNVSQKDAVVVDACNLATLDVVVKGTKVVAPTVSGKELKK